MNLDYVGREEQLCSVQSCRLEGGRGDGMRLVNVRNGLGMEFTVVPDRCADIYRLTFMGRNMSYFAPCGYVAPGYYDDRGAGFLNSFTAGFLTTCGLTNAGNPCTEDGEYFPMHGSIGNVPAEYFTWYQDENAITLEAQVREARLFGRKLKLQRRIVCSKKENTFTIRDTVTNFGDSEEPILILYHMNMGYPLLSEKSELYIPSVKVTPRSPKAAENLSTHLQMLTPQAHYEEECFFHEFEGEGKAMLYNPDIDLGLGITFPIGSLDQMCQWKMMGKQEYVLGLEPANCSPDGRVAMKEQGKRKTLLPGQSETYEITVRLYEGKNAWEQAKQ